MTDDRSRIAELWAGSIIAIGVVALQGLLTLKPLDLFAYFAILAFAVSIPIQACYVSMRFLRRRMKGTDTKSLSRWHEVFFTFGTCTGVAGVIAIFWHISPLAGALFLLSGVVSGIVFLRENPLSDFFIRKTRLT